MNLLSAASLFAIVSSPYLLQNTININIAIKTITSPEIYIITPPFEIILAVCSMDNSLRITIPAVKDCFMIKHCIFATSANFNIQGFTLCTSDFYTFRILLP
jgi:hypothetical protein